MVRKVTTSPLFENKARKLDGAQIERLRKLMEKIVEDPDIGKPMRYERKGTREVYMPPFRLSYAYDPNEEHIIFLDLYPKKHQ